MEEEIQIDPVYKKGFEHGYWLRRGDSKELDGLIDRSNHSGYKGGLLAGKKEAERERVRNRLKESRDQAQEHGLDLD